MKKWKGLNVAARRNFKEEILALVPSLSVEELKSKVVHCTLTQEIELQQTQKRASGGDFLDSPDLRDKYKNKPDQLKNLLDRAPRIFDKVRGVQLYQDVQFSGHDEQNLSEKSSLKRSLDFNEKGAKKERKPKEPLPEGCSPHDALPLHEGILQPGARTRFRPCSPEHSAGTSGAARPASTERNAGTLARA